MNVTPNEKDRTVFVIAPIGVKDSPERRRSDQVLRHLIKPVIEKHGYSAVRADDIPKPGVITTQIIGHLLNDHLVIADLSGRNPNVFYELAVRHMIQKPTIQIIQKGDQIPFDVSTQRTISFDNSDWDSLEEAKKELENQIIAVEKDPTLVDSPILTAINLQSLKGSQNPEQTAIASIQSTLSDLAFEIREIKRKLNREALSSRPIFSTGHSSNSIFSTDGPSHISAVSSFPVEEPGYITSIKEEKEGKEGKYPHRKQTK
jgi:hypothetical protein